QAIIHPVVHHLLYTVPAANRPLNTCAQIYRNPSGTPAPKRFSITMVNATDVVKKLENALDVVTTYGKPIVHWGFIPTVILVGMLTTKPRPTLGQLLWLG
ncbi:hypothetical protein VaNZ11_007142, partial [Volvox africanus]